MNKNKTLDSFKLYYEDIKFRAAQAIKKDKKIKPVSKVSNTSSVKKVTPKAPKRAFLDEHRNVILGIGSLLVIVSIAYSTSVILLGVDSIGSKISLLPQVVFALIISIKAFSRLYK